MQNVSNDCNFFPFHFTQFFSYREYIQQNLSRVFVRSISCIHDAGLHMSGENCAAPACGWRMTTISTIARILFTVSISVSPLLTDDEDAANWLHQLKACVLQVQKDNRVRVEFSKKRFAMVTSRSRRDFLDWTIKYFFECIRCGKYQFNISQDWSSFLFQSKCFTLRAPILLSYF